MTRIYIYLFIVLFLSCSSDSSIKKTKTSVDDFFINKNKSDTVEEIDSTIRFFAETSSHGDTIRILQKRYNLNLSIRNTNDTFRIINSDISNLEFKDFNGDGFEDIVYRYASGATGSIEVSLYNEISNSYIEVQGISDYPTPKLLEDEYYYSYVKAGCADNDWISYLLTIKDFKTSSPIGLIAGRGCRTGLLETGIFVDKFENGRRITFDSLLRRPGYYGDKYEFIEKYWLENYDCFESSSFEGKCVDFLCEKERSILKKINLDDDLFSINGECGYEVNLDSDTYIESIFFVKNDNYISLVIYEGDDDFYKLEASSIPINEGMENFDWVETFTINSSKDTIFRTIIDTVTGDIVGPDPVNPIIPKYNSIRFGVEEAGGSLILYSDGNNYLWINIE